MALSAIGYFFYAFIVNASNYKLSRWAMPLIFAGTVFYFCYACTAYKREENLLTDVDLILPYLKQKDTLLVESDMWNYFNLHSYLYIGKQVNLTGNPANRKFFIGHKNTPNDSLHSRYIRLNLPTQDLELFIIKK